MDQRYQGNERYIFSSFALVQALKIIGYIQPLVSVDHFEARLMRHPPRCPLLSACSRHALPRDKYISAKMRINQVVLPFLRRAPPEHGATACACGHESLCTQAHARVCVCAGKGTSEKHTRRQSQSQITDSIFINM